MKEKPLKLWNGNAGDMSRLVGEQPYRSAHAYVAAYSRADAIRMIEELMDRKPASIETQIREYWSAGCWGTAMDGVTPERGIWISKNGHTSPIRVYPEEGVLPVGTLECPRDGERLYFETWGGMRVRTEVTSAIGRKRHVYDAMCPECRKNFTVKAVQEQDA